MAERTNESVSALMDGEVADFELRRTLDRVEQEPELSAAWQRYHLIRSSMRNEELSAVDISGQVMAALQDEPAFSEQSVASDVEKETEPHSSKYLFWKPLASMAAAASVTAMVILGVQSVNQQPDEVIADTRPSYVLPGNRVSNDIVRAQFGNRTGLAEPASEPEIIRLSRGVEHYIDQHKHMLNSKESHWQAGWLPEGFVGLKRDVMAHAEVQVFSNGRNSFSVCIEEYGRQSVPEGVAQSGNMVAVGKRMGDQFVTVVGDVPLMIAERIASSVQRR
ncbi:MucB/RseB C-terminal domain-containing protein [Neptuniibacter halophilus]|uniref:MucB/RseB C-terminal domain-containing protein n=1 Tax=Neptuniibacter halophilus TaxID=651666 RepID=UPI00257402E8|nr:MucB/RseB C-terminal domain-containing protein [Neptuniibacter halophilus]